MSLTKSVAAGDLLVSGTGKTFDINVNDLLAGNSLSSNSISLGQLTVFGHSDAVYQTQIDAFGSYKFTGTRSHFNAGACNHGVCSVTDNVYTRTGSSFHYDNISDTMKVTVGDSSDSDTTGLQQRYERPSTNEDGRSGSSRWGWNIYETTADDYYRSYSGDLSVTLDLDSKALSDIIKDGILNLSIFGVRGQFNVDSLRLDLLANMPEPANDTQVPVPTSLLLTGLGLAALATVRRRKA